MSIDTSREAQAAAVSKLPREFQSTCMAEPEYMAKLVNWIKTNPPIKGYELRAYWDDMEGHFWKQIYEFVYLQRCALAVVLAGYEIYGRTGLNYRIRSPK